MRKGLAAMGRPYLCPNYVLSELRVGMELAVSFDNIREVLNIVNKVAITGSVRRARTGVVELTGYPLGCAGRSLSAGWALRPVRVGVVCWVMALRSSTLKRPLH